MLSWAYVNLKPGVGKTTCAVFTCAALAERGFRPLLADCDPAASALRWSDLASR
ncbi:MAG: ParA family protein [Pseudonocardiaceae bacterium]